jgi:hypothetical protein
VNILFLSHAANRSGAPLVLLNLLRYLRSDTPHQATVLSLREGPLTDEWARVAQVATSPVIQRVSKLAGAPTFLQERGLSPRLGRPLVLARRVQLLRDRGRSRSVRALSF